MRSFSISSFISILIIGLVTSLTVSCKKEGMTTDTTPRNLLSGVADGTAFATTNIAAIKDSTDVFLMLGTMGTSGSFLAAFGGREEKEYLIAEEGALVALTNYLNDLITADSFFIDTTALQQIFSDSAQLLPEGSAFMFFIPDDIPLFSRRGNIRLNKFDGTINRIYGTMEGEFVNADEGPKYINVAFEDVFYLDCPLANDCGF